MRRLLQCYLSAAVTLLAAAVISACTAPSLPIVGISCSRSKSGGTLLPTTYSDAIRMAGGVPVVIPTVCTVAEAEAALAAVDGIMFSGGEDVNPAWYGEEVWNETVEVDSVRDRSDSILARAALASGKPVLAICRGSQLLNVVLGGSLYQDIPTQCPSGVCHRGGAMHNIGLAAGSILSRIFGPDSLNVNSMHHQAVKDPAPGITITGRAADGTVEAWETPQIWAVQFHPEKMLAAGDERWIPLFESFVDRLR
ncbi:MAG: gamma-glutamyl-gamma-aminobutyrate hydrolase family protein [Bacteroidales bacterium]|nr:gamma-glutamyl-gamma-aminobutyrate hydrolase family protein [Bacteroidales bacterium]